MKIEAMKTGMLFDAANTRAVASSLKEFYGEQLPPLVVRARARLERAVPRVALGEQAPLDEQPAGDVRVDARTERHNGVAI